MGLHHSFKKKMFSIQYLLSNYYVLLKSSFSNVNLFYLDTKNVGHTLIPDFEERYK